MTMSDQPTAPVVDAQKVLAATDAIELRVLRNIQSRLDAGERVGKGDLVALDNIRRRYQQPDTQVQERWVKLKPCADELNVTEVWLRNWVHGKRNCTPVLPHKIMGGIIHVVPHVVYEHIKAHAKKGSGKMRPPQGYQDAAPAQPPPSVLANFDVSGSPHELLQKILADKDVLMGLSESKIRAVVAAAGELGRDRERQARMAGALKAEKVLEMLRALVFIFANLIHERATARASTLLKFVHAEFGVDLAKSQPAACSLMADQLRALAQEDVTALHEELRQQTEGVRLPELEPEVPDDV